MALTSLGFDTHGADGVFGPRSREMIHGLAASARNQPTTGFLTAAQQQALLGEAAPALAKYDDDLKKAEARRRRGGNARRLRPQLLPAALSGQHSSAVSSCQDASGRRMDFPGATSCPYGLMPAR